MTWSVRESKTVVKLIIISLTSDVGTQVQVSGLSLSQESSLTTGLPNTHFSPGPKIIYSYINILKSFQKDLKTKLTSIIGQDTCSEKQMVKGDFNLPIIIQQS